MLHRRSLTMTAAITTAALALTACGEDAGGEDDVVSIDFYYPIAVGGPLESVIDGYIEQFNDEHEDYEVTAVYSGDYEQTRASVQSAAQAGNSPGLTVLGANELLSVHEAGIITPIGEIVEDQEWFDSFYEPFMGDSTLPDGTVASIPFQRSTVVMYWNKELFDAAGLDPEVPPETWEEMVEFGEQAQDAGADWGVQIPSTSWGVWMLEAMTIQNGSMLWDPETGTDVAFDDPATVTALQNWADLQADGLEPSGTVDWGTLPTEFSNGATAMIWTTTGQLTNISENAQFDFGVAPLPAQEQAGSPTGGGNLYVMDGIADEQQEAAVALARFLSSPEIQSDWGVESGYVAPLDAAWETEPLASYAEEFPQAAVAREQLAVAEPEFGVYRRQEVFDVMANSIEAVMGGADVDSELEQAQQQADSILDEYR
ncbi:ABC transporter substrate-binding protein [Nesterenkonia salmonea]|uniref:ABC transporter substrate-binding protein n=1 Tax=Nesterenkonia salmonea TaxID=1804987 RepID=A0A5R9B882_9MICC|nr:ABC transporter substrate-binding protein [Nesterenkonia salmonea]TLP93837.1 ABC transporter substrate-binding protein [Nesterenkonia salmonea]